MDYQRVTERQALEMLKLWSVAGRDLSSLVKLQPANNRQLVALLPGYLDNEWYQFGEAYSCYTEAFSSLGGLLDKMRLTS
ncbi:hypothetical protein WG68_08595 [Arsukibacterium ikkense]|uniref:Uncharacterized protein n=1 Tax=Arsukibacterium ikkense TaxID=336831 RepID=A0A0M2V5U9_9GAMM|nr:hypothetical protein [Arsukibacterium ikkense]KKO45764.1 hypothetical protein WG68_08595 [Arsukibacterium ikkense]